MVLSLLAFSVTIKAVLLVHHLELHDLLNLFVIGRDLFLTLEFLCEHVFHSSVLLLRISVLVVHHSFPSALGPFQSSLVVNEPKVG